MVNRNIVRQAACTRKRNFKSYAKMLTLFTGMMAYMFVVSVVLLFVGIYYMKDHPSYQEGWKQLSRMLGI